MSIHEKVARRVRRWDPDVVVSPSITSEQWRTVRRRGRARVVIGLTVSALLSVLVVIQLATGWHLRPLRVVAFAAIVVAVLILAVVVVTIAGARGSLVQRHPELFSSRRALAAEAARAAAADPESEPLRASPPPHG